MLVMPDDRLPKFRVPGTVRVFGRHSNDDKGLHP
jgi:hypothetical protein